VRDGTELPEELLKKIENLALLSGMTTYCDGCNKKLEERRFNRTKNCKNYTRAIGLSSLVTTTSNDVQNTTGYLLHQLAEYLMRHQPLAISKPSVCLKQSLST